ncbi:MAG: hypothetical protein E4G74_03225, partial [Erysipelotrichales bacterium]
MKKYAKVAFCILILASALTPLAGYVIGFNTPDYAQGSSLPFPAFIDNHRVNLSFTSQFDDYFSQRFPFRTYMVSAYNGIQEVFLGQSGNSQVIVGTHGFLFFEETLDDYLKASTLSDNDLIRLNHLLNLQKRYLDGLGIASYFMVVPNKASIYAEFMPANLKSIGKIGNLDRLLTMDLSMPFIDLRTPLL